MGSGKYLKRAIKKYGLDNFEREILFYLETKDEMYEKEREIVTETFILTNNTYNLKIGGSGGNPGISGAFKGKQHTEETKQKIKFARQFQDPPSIETRNKISINNGMKNNIEARKKLSLANLGKKLINNGIIAKRVDLKDLDYYLLIGWQKGKIPNQKL
jgi:predicted metal-dependent RNase